jgi:hypothetical protein
MAVLTRLSLDASERFDLPSARLMEINSQTDWLNFLRGVFSEKSYIVTGFELTNYADIFASGLPRISISDAVVLHNEAATQAAGFYVSAGTEADEAVSLSASSINYVEADFVVETGATDQKAKWNQAANGGAGAEYNDEADTVINLKVSISVNTTGFSTGKFSLYKFTTNGSNIVTAFEDCRDLFFRLGTGGTSPDPANQFAWPSLPSAGYARTDTAGTATSSSDPIPTQGGDKNIKTQKQWMDAVMTKLLELGGTPTWFGAGIGSIAGALRQASTIIVPLTSGAKWGWSGSALSISDSSGAPASTDNIASIRRMGIAGALNLRRADGTGSTSTIAIPDGSVLYVTLPVSGSQNFSGASYNVVGRDFYTVSDLNYWIAYREGSKLIIRGSAELEAGEDEEIGDGVSLELLSNIGLTSETASPSYSSDIRGTAAQSLVARLGVLTSAVGDQQEDRSGQLRSTTSLTWNGASLAFTSNLVLDILNTKNGTANAYTVLAGSSIALADGESAYITVTRGTTANATIVKTGTTPLPAQLQANKDTFVLFTRRGSDLQIPFHKQTILTGTTFRLGTAPGSAAARAYPTYLLSPAGNGDGTTFAAALAALPGAGGVILLIDAITVNSTVTIPANVKVLGRSKNAVLTLGASGTLVFSGANSSIEELNILTTQNITMVDVNAGNYFNARNCVFSAPVAGTAISIRVRATGCHVGECTFSGVLSPSTSTGIQFDAGYAGNTESNNNWTT